MLINTVRKGYTSAEGVKVKPNLKVSTVLVLQANLGLRISDVINLKQTDTITEGNRYRLNITEQKTGKKRDFTVPPEIYTYIQGYMLERGIKYTQPLFDIGIRAVQKHLRITARHLALEGIGTHSFRKFFCTEIYNNSSYNIELCRVLMQHSTSAVTQRYIGIQPQVVEQALANHVKLPS